jgi:apolipoprotein N-acyltransferase
MAYIFSVIGISVINAVVLQVFNILGVIIMNLIVILTAFILEQYLQSNNFAKYKVAYDNLDMLRPENQQKLLQEMSQKTGRNIFKVKIIEMDFKKDIAHLEIYYKEQ